jgi:protoporphyrinogen IX oxidase
VRGWLLTLHFIALVMWMGGLFMVVRLLGYHAIEPPSVRATLRRIEARANYLYAWPGAILSCASGALLVRLYGLAWLRVSLWLQVKLVLLAILLLIHLGITRAQRRIAGSDLDHPVARGWNVMAFLLLAFLVAIVGLSVHRPLVGG